LQDGDIVFRRGSGFVSEIARNFSEKDKRYSHVGILAKTDAGVIVVHSLFDSDKRYNGVVKEELAEYLKGIDEWAVYRVNENRVIRDKIASLALAASDIGILFDDEYNLETESKLYCTEFVLKMVNIASKEQIILPKTNRLGKLFISISDVYVNPKLFLVMKSKSNNIK
jgi:hypothetical protein